MMENRYLPEGMLTSTKENKEALSSRAELEAAMRRGQILEAPALLCDADMRLHVDLGCATGVIEREEAAACRPGEEIKDIAIITRVGKPVAFKIISLTEDDYGNVIAKLSRRAAQEECAAAFLSTLIPGDLITAKVTHLENYGAFVDIGCGISSLLSIDCISVSRITHPRDRLRCGMYLTVAIKSIDRYTRRIFVTLKELLGTWQENADAFRAGQTVVGLVRSIESYGIFIELAPNLAGLAELRTDEKGAATVTVGDTATVFIKSILPERMKVKLVIIDSYAAETPPAPLKYYISPRGTTHIDRWQYSPDCSRRLVETVFDE